MARRKLPIQLATVTEAQPRTASLCHGCARLEGRNDDGTARCEAFDVIPAAIWAGRADHHAAINGDDGITFLALGEYGSQVERAFLASLGDDRIVTTREGTMVELDTTPEENRPDTPMKQAESLPDAPPEEFHCILGIEGAPSGDRRQVDQGALTWRDLPLPFTSLHDDGEHGAQITRVERQGDVIHGWGYFMDVAAGYDLRQRLEAAGGRLGCSWELDDVELEIDWPDGADEDLFAEPELVRFTQARLTGASEVPTPAFSEMFIELLDPAATQAQTTAVTASVSIAERIPVHPPLEWFTNPRLNEPTPLHVSDDGRVYGHLAQWGQCHIGFQGTCVTPPYEAAMDYFLTGELVTEDGTRVPVGQLTLAGGHADLALDARAAVAHYDSTGSAVADLNCGPDSIGIWVAGALRPGVTPEQVRVLMASPPSGDWRRISGAFRLVAAANVNVPGFPTTRARVASGVQVSLVAAGIVWNQHRDPLDAVAELLAGRIGRDRRALAASLAQRVHLPILEAGCNCGKKRPRAASAGAVAGSGSPGKVEYEIVPPGGGSRYNVPTLIAAIRESRKIGGRYKVVRA